jgi:hypothetical protein
MNACIAGCIFAYSLPNLWLGIGALKIHGTYQTNDFVILAEYLLSLWRYFRHHDPSSPPATS